MSSKLTDAIKRMTLAARELLMEEASSQLEGIYGFLPNGELKPAENYPAVRKNPYAAETRRCIEEFIENEKIAGFTPLKAREKLVREVAFTWLNRFVAFKMLEARKLIRQTISRGENSNGFLMWLAKPENKPYLEEYEAGDFPQDELGEGPRQRAYRHFILAQCAKLAEEIRVLFDPEVLPSRLFPRPRILKKLIELLNAEELTEAWQPGNEETIGWVYQGFISEELERAFREVRESKTKFQASDIPTVTQLFTPKWIVKFLVENTLGRLWIQMHPDSELRSKLTYLVPLEDKKLPKEVTKPVKDIKLLDPACGTMHFGLVAFDLFYDMYKEELANAGKPGWPIKPSVEKEEDIPVAIIANNIYGIDIDLRAVQLSALTLYLKAKSKNKEIYLQQSNLACANIHLINGKCLNDFLENSGLQNPIYRRILSVLQERLKDSEQLGSLLRLEEEISELVEEERQRYLREGKQPDLFGWSREQFETEEGRQEFWEMLEIQIIQALNEFARQQARAGTPQTFFAGEATKGLKLLELLSQRYDVVVTNPPYMSARKMNARLKELLADQYPEAKGDLYAAFIQRCLELAREGGRIGMLTMHSFMFISSYENLRKKIREKAVIETLIHAGPGLFSVGNPGTLQTAAYVLRREPDEEIRNNSVGVYFRLVKEKDGEAKRRAFKKALEELRRKVYNKL